MNQVTSLVVGGNGTLTPQAILEAFSRLPVGDAVEWTQTDDPSPLHQALMAQWPGQFAWDRQDLNGDAWTLRLTRKPAGKSCCGCCGG